MTITNDSFSYSTNSAHNPKAISNGSFKNIVCGLFSNLRGIELGAKKAGFEPVFSTDISLNAEAVFNAQHAHLERREEVFVLQDVNALTGEQVAKSLAPIGVDLSSLDIASLVGGPSCFGMTKQSVNTRSVFHPYNMLMIEFVRMVRELRPMTVWMEQVPDLLRKPFRDFREFLFNHLDSLEEYQWDVAELNAENFGCYQSRSRATLVMVRKDLKVDPSFPAAKPVDLLKQSAYAVIGAEQFRSKQFSQPPVDGRSKVFGTLTSSDFEIFRNRRWEKLTLADRLKLAHMDDVPLLGVSNTTLKSMLGMMVIPPFAEAVMLQLRSILEDAGKFAF